MAILDGVSFNLQFSYPSQGNNRILKRFHQDISSSNTRRRRKERNYDSWTSKLAAVGGGWTWYGDMTLDSSGDYKKQWANGSQSTTRRRIIAKGKKGKRASSLYAKNITRSVSPNCFMGTRRRRLPALIKLRSGSTAEKSAPKNVEKAKIIRFHILIGFFNHNL